MINGLKQAFSLDEAVLQFGLQIFKSVAGQNFCQGRRIATVAACSLYAAARCFKAEQYNSSWRDYQCKVMIIDFADHLGVSCSESNAMTAANFSLDKCLSHGSSI